MGSQGTILSGQKNNGGSPLMGLIQAGSSLYGGSKSSQSSGALGMTPSGYDAQNPSQSQVPTISDPTFGSSIEEDSGDGSSAIDRRVDANNQNPDVLIAQGIKHLEDPNNGLDLDTKMSLVRPMFEAQHFGLGGMPASLRSQGQIKSGTLPESGGISKIASIAALA